MSELQPCLVIRSVQEDGQRFRPSDWIERISSSVAQYGPDRRLRYTRLVHPQVIDGEKCLVVNGAFAKQQPALYDHILEFVRSNRLRLENGRCSGAMAA
jgi:hypothetical protein